MSIYSVNVLAWVLLSHEPRTVYSNFIDVIKRLLCSSHLYRLSFAYKIHGQMVIKQVG